MQSGYSLSCFLLEGLIGEVGRCGVVDVGFLILFVGSCVFWDKLVAKLNIYIFKLGSTHFLPHAGPRLN